MLFIKYLLITLLFDLIVNEDDNNNIYCGQKEIKLIAPLSILYPKINNQYGKDNLYCEYNLYNSGIQTKKIKLKIEKFFKDIEISYTIKYKNKNYEDVKERLKKKSNADSVIKELVKNREKNFLNKKLLKKEEEKILKKKIRLYWL